MKILSLVVLTLSVAVAGCTSAAEPEATESASVATTSGATTVKADIYVDNWFALYHEDTLIKEDSVPFKTERSFNSESFEFNVSLPAQLSIIMKDFFENDSGLEYIGSRRQQMGDGGFIAQFFDANSGDLLSVSNNDWRCKVIHRAPLDQSCERSSNPEQSCQSQIEGEPDSWRSKDFDASLWSSAVVHELRDVRPRGGYQTVDWHSSADLIWGDDLEKDNIVLCRFTISAQ